MKVLIVSANFFPMPAAGAAYIAGAAMQAGYDVQVFNCQFVDDLALKLKEHLVKFDPDVVGISILSVTADIRDTESAFYTQYVDLRPKVKEIVDCVKQHSKAQIVLGGPGFNYYGPYWFEYLDLDYGIRGEGEYAFPQFLELFDQGGDLSTIPGCIYIENGEINKQPRQRVEDLDNAGCPAYDLFHREAMDDQRVICAIFTKRGCAFKCTFCPHASLEGARYRLKSPNRVVSEIKHILKSEPMAIINFSDNTFNSPKKHAEAILREIINQGLQIEWRTGAMKPLGITREFCDLFKSSGCGYVGLSIESASDKMLKNMRRGYQVRHVREALDNLSDSGIDFGLSVMLGAPGETPETIAETFQVLDEYPAAVSTWVNIGLYLWTPHQDIVEFARQAGQLENDRRLFDGGYYISPELPEEYMVDLIESLAHNDKYFIQVNKPYASYQKQVNIT